MEKLKISEHFNLSDFACKCCGELIVNDLLEEFIDRLEVARCCFKFQIHVNCGHRCVKHNKEVGGTADSMHLQIAGDFTPLVGNNERDKKHLLKRWYDCLAEAGFTGLGIYYKKNFVHADLGKERRWDDE
jgi:uncharacterized protein YcbK (DUF882 family)